MWVIAMRRPAKLKSSFTGDSTIPREWRA